MVRTTKDDFYKILTVGLYTFKEDKGAEVPTSSAAALDVPLHTPHLQKY